MLVTSRCWLQWSPLPPPTPPHPTPPQPHHHHHHPSSSHPINRTPPPCPTPPTPPTPLHPLPFEISFGMATAEETKNEDNRVEIIDIDKPNKVPATHHESALRAVDARTTRARCQVSTWRCWNVLRRSAQTNSSHQHIPSTTVFTRTKPLGKPSCSRSRTCTETVGNLVSPFVHITSWMTRHLATLRDSS